MSISRLSFDPARHQQILDLLKEPARLEGDCLYLPDPQVSRQHAVLQRADDGSWSIEDAGSRNGTLVNDRAVTGRTPLNVGDRITVGQSHIDFFAESDWVPAPEWLNGGSD
jgi:pSer/pThr/pTyr-binding forkhead associated (FHA) protein